MQRTRKECARKRTLTSADQIGKPGKPANSGHFGLRAAAVDESHAAASQVHDVDV
jgi:hypothetical protein